MNDEKQEILASRFDRGVMTTLLRVNGELRLRVSNGNDVLDIAAGESHIASFGRTVEAMVHQMNMKDFNS
jgi:hypothetical protein